ncbi:terminase small subunit [Bacillus phage Novomoskovsk]|uniref:Terminase small subunit n=1 Tax=Bacillus phage Novomoskovsk TaxID=2736258 RepID=A0A6M9Z784_9CAUD|nr:terminase small subunit [Bacillus phage Novomoskovsk]QKN88269.1 terminase small subunit [Bacillus phage Novomoskovsk]
MSKHWKDKDYEAKHEAEHIRRYIRKAKEDPEGAIQELNDMQYDKARIKKYELIKDLLKDVDIICGARIKNGRICSKPPVEGRTRCAAHGGNSPHPMSEEAKQRQLAHLNPRAHFVYGLYGGFTMTEHEDAFYIQMMNHYIPELDLDPINVLTLDRALRNFILNQRKEHADAGEAINGIQFDIDYDSKFLKFVQSLGMDRKFNISKEHKDNGATLSITDLFASED